MKWVRVENRSENGFAHYYLNKDELLLITKNDGDYIKCKLPNGLEKQLKLIFKIFENRASNAYGIVIISQTKKWFVIDEKIEYPIEEIEISKDDILQYIKPRS
jgi:hypothetical protein